MSLQSSLPDADVSFMATYHNSSCSFCGCTRSTTNNLLLLCPKCNSPMESRGSTERSGAARVVSPSGYDRETNTWDDREADTAESIVGAFTSPVRSLSEAGVRGEAGLHCPDCGAHNSNLSVPQDGRWVLLVASH